MKILMTGASGYLGSCLTAFWHRAGHEVTAFSLVGTCVPNDVDAVVHTACCSGRNGESESEVNAFNVECPLRLLNGLTTAAVFLNIDTILPPALNAYARSKDAFRRAGSELAAQRGISWHNIRLDHFYGPGERPDKFVTRTVRDCLEKQYLPFTKGEQRRDFIFIDDIVSAVDMVLRLAREGTSTSNVRVGSGCPVTIRELVGRIHRLCNSEAELQFGALPYRDHEPMNPETAGAASMVDFGWRQSVGLEEGLKQVVQFEQARLERERKVRA